MRIRCSLPQAMDVMAPEDQRRAFSHAELRMSRCQSSNPSILAIVLLVRHQSCDQCRWLHKTRDKARSPLWCLQFWRTYARREGVRNWENCTNVTSLSIMPVDTPIPPFSSCLTELAFPAVHHIDSVLRLQSVCCKLEALFSPSLDHRDTRLLRQEHLLLTT